MRGGLWNVKRLAAFGTLPGTTGGVEERLEVGPLAHRRSPKDSRTALID
jgi:hypothetical protein